MAFATVPETPFEEGEAMSSAWRKRLVGLVVAILLLVMIGGPAAADALRGSTPASTSVRADIPEGGFLPCC
jgi:hypothetical protein